MGKQKFTVLMIITDGAIMDMDQTIHAIVKASALPMAIGGFPSPPPPPLPPPLAAELWRARGFGWGIRPNRSLRTWRSPLQA